MKLVIPAVAVACIATNALRYIGVVAAEGSFWVDSAGVSDHATLFEGSTVETTGATAKLRIGATVRVLLDANSRAQVHADRLLLEKGRGQLESGANYRMEARTLRVTLGSAESRAVVAIGDSAVEVASLNGQVRVANADGVLVANIEAGRAVELRLEQGRDTSVLTGCVAKAGSAYMMRDEASAVTVELRGAEMAGQTGKRVQVTGKVVPSERAEAPADQVLQATEVKVLEAGCSATIVAAGNGSRARFVPHVSSMVAHLGGIPGAVVAGVGVTAGSAVAVKAIQSHRHQAPPISPGR